jgi:hypothetical protein
MGGCHSANAPPPPAPPAHAHPSKHLSPPETKLYVRYARSPVCKSLHSMYSHGQSLLRGVDTGHHAPRRPKPILIQSLPPSHREGGRGTAPLARVKHIVYPHHTSAPPLAKLLPRSGTSAISTGEPSDSVLVSSASLTAPARP